MPGPLSVCGIFERTERISTKYNTGRSLLNVMKLFNFGLYDPIQNPYS
jgi:hypothetical protein